MKIYREKLAGCIFFSCWRINNSDVCRICYSTGDLQSLINPCECSGTMGILHQNCLEHWLEVSNTTQCEICHHEFQVVRYPKSLFHVCIWKKKQKIQWHQLRTYMSLVSQKSSTFIRYSLFNQRYYSIYFLNNYCQLVFDFSKYIKKRFHFDFFSSG